MKEGARQSLILSFVRIWTDEMVSMGYKTRQIMQISKNEVTWPSLMEDYIVS